MSADQLQLNAMTTYHTDVLYFQMLLSEHVATNIVNSTGATPLHLARDPAIIKVGCDIGTKTV